MMLQEANVVGIVVILVILWFLGVVTKNTLGGLLHILTGHRHHLPAH
jgi:hypothetical protein